MSVIPYPAVEVGDVGVHNEAVVVHFVRDQPDLNVLLHYQRAPGIASAKKHKSPKILENHVVKEMIKAVLSQMEALGNLG